MKRSHPRAQAAGRLAAWSSLILIIAPASIAQEAAPAPAMPPPGVRRAFLVCGLPGDDEHRALYAGAVETIARALADRCGFAPADVWVRFGVEASEGDGPALKGSRGLSTAEGIAADVELIRKASKPEDALWVIALGHGHFDGRRSHFNIPGPDLSDAAFGKLFEKIEAKEQVFFATTSASGFFLKPLAKPGRIAISATEADQEVNETLFPLALADMLAAPPPEADRDKDGTLSVFELYLAIVADVTRRYVEDELIPSEHAQLDDNGDGRGTEVQRTFLPPESGGEAGAEKKDKPKGKGEPKEKPAPVLGPKDDGSLASKTRVDHPAGGPR